MNERMPYLQTENERISEINIVNTQIHIHMLKYKNVATVLWRTFSDSF